MPNKKVKASPAASVSSKATKHSISLRLSTLITAILFVLLICASFYSGTVYQKSQSKTPVNNSSYQKHFDWGMVVYISPSSITIDSQRSGNAQQLKITKSTLISVDGSKANASQIREGEIVLIRVVNHNTAAIILVNSNFTE